MNNEYETATPDQQAEAFNVLRDHMGLIAREVELQVLSARTLALMAQDALSAAQRILQGGKTTHPQNVGTPIDPDWSAGNEGAFRR